MEVGVTVRVLSPLISETQNICVLHLSGLALMLMLSIMMTIGTVMVRTMMTVDRLGT